MAVPSGVTVAKPSYAPLAAFIVITAGIQALGPDAVRDLRLQANYVAEPWRLLTGHWVHLTWQHWLLNITTLTVFSALFDSLRRPYTLLCAGTCAMLVVNVGVLVRHPNVDWYVGFSGVLYGLLAAGALLDRHRHPRISTAVLAFVTLKLLADVTFGTPKSIETIVGGPVMAAAHVYGVAGGLLAAVILDATTARSHH